MTKLGALTVVLLIGIVPTTNQATSQTYAVPWYSFNCGFGIQTSTTMRVEAVLGQQVVGQSSNGSSTVSSGFLFGMARILGVEGDRQTDTPERYALDQNYPNPFNPATTIQFELPKRSVVSLNVYDILGRNVLTLVDGPMDAGRHRVELNSSALASGAYFYRLETEGFVKTMKLLVIK